LAATQYVVAGQKNLMKYSDGDPTRTWRTCSRRRSASL